MNTTLEVTPMYEYSSKPLAELIQGFFINYMMQQRQVSHKTIASYRDCFKIYYRFLQESHGVKPEKVNMQHFEKEYVLDFINYMKNVRLCSEHTINLRMAVIRSFLKKYVSFEAPEYSQTVRSVLAIPPMRFEKKVMTFITKEEYQSLLKACNKSSGLMNRDKIILSILYNTGCRVSELINIQVKDLRNLNENGNSSVLLHGKGRKERVVPLWNSTAKLIAVHIKQMNLSSADYIVYTNNQCRMTRSGVSQRIDKLVKIASIMSPSLNEKNVTPHTFRHSVAMNMLQSGIDISTIAIFLGHESIETTHKYIVSDIEMKKKALASIHEICPAAKYYKPSSNILKFLENL